MCNALTGHCTCPAGECDRLLCSAWLLPPPLPAPAAWHPMSAPRPPRRAPDALVFAGWTGFNCIQPMKRYCTHKWREWGFETERTGPHWAYVQAVNPRTHCAGTHMTCLFLCGQAFVFADAHPTARAPHLQDTATRPLAPATARPTQPTGGCLPQRMPPWMRLRSGTAGP